MMANVSLSTEYVLRMTLDALPMAIPSCVDPEDKIVIRIAADGLVPARIWIRRLFINAFFTVR